ncbi:MAG: SH3 domain-containing protein, partial [Nitrospira sp.]|nr:SH3 domain-containing protein [Nitrospira sp.]
IGPAIPPGTAFTILDGDLQEHGWVYYVQSNYGTKGWLAEKQLKRNP